MKAIEAILAILLVLVSFFGDKVVKWFFDRKNKGD